MAATQGQDLFGMKLDQLEKFSRGEHLGATKLNKSIDTTNRNSAQLRPAGQVFRTVVPTFAQFVLSAIKRDYLICRHVDFLGDGTIGEEDIKILKPWILRKTPFHNQTRDGITYVYGAAADAQSRVGTDEEDNTEEQVIVPSYNKIAFESLRNDMIVAVRGVVGLRADGLFNDFLEEDAHGAVWLDMNNDARMWAEATA